MINRPLQHMSAVIWYVLEFEKDDFEINPSDDHVYYHAFAYDNGEEAAQEMLKESIKENE